MISGIITIIAAILTIVAIYYGNKVWKAWVQRANTADQIREGQARRKEGEGEAAKDNAVEKKHGDIQDQYPKKP